jgi:hypothetical protein
MINKNLDIKSYHSSENFYNSIVFGVIIVHMTDNDDLNLSEINELLVSITFFTFFICELEYMGFL